jgi:hypothetical protein
MKKIILFLLIYYSCTDPNAPSAPSGSHNQVTDPKIAIPSSSYLMRFDREDSMAECKGKSGVYLYSGADINNNGVLEDSEVYSKSYLCDGSTGIAGISGTNGSNGKNALVFFKRQDNITECSGPGLIILNGVDLNSNAILDPEEIQQTSYVCDGSAAKSSDFAIKDIIIPCGKIAGIFNETLLQLENGDILAYFESGSNRFLSIIGPGYYQTTDTKHCLFTIHSDGGVTWN